ncbi:MAG: hypothetical protein GY867_08865 [bacterium]|nr:hypothetical protein [bacterium]
MMRVCTLIAAVVVFVLAGVSCTRVQPEPDTNVVANLAGLPTAYGELVSVTTAAPYPDWAQLWFVDDEGIIRMVRVQFEQKQIHNDVLVIPRQ